MEKEYAESGEIVSTATIFLTNRECPWRCVMCDLWKNTLTETVPVGAIPAQIDYALSELHHRAGVSPAHESADHPCEHEPAFENVCGRESSRRRDAGPTLRQIKLYNSGSFFDPRAIPPDDYSGIADRVRCFERVIVECHPALVGERCLKFRDLLSGSGGKSRSSRHQEAPTDLRNTDSETNPSLLTSAATRLEVAMGLETANPLVLEKLNKRMTLEHFSRAAEFLRQNDIALRVFILVKPPFIVDEAQALHWAERSIDFAFDCDASVVSLIPTRFGNGALEGLAATGEFSPPKLATLESATDYGIALERGRVFADLWDVEKFSDCAECFPKRLERLRLMNQDQVVRPGLQCSHCGTDS